MGYEEKIAEYANRLEGMSKKEWFMVKIVIDHQFRIKSSELDKGIQLTTVTAEDVTNC